MLQRVRGLTKGLVAVVFWRHSTDGQANGGPRGILIRPLVGSDNKVTTFGIRQVTAATLDPASDATGDPESADALLDDVQAWKTRRDDLVGLALELPDFPPNEVEAAAFAAVVARFEKTVGELRRLADDLKLRLQDASSPEALGYLEQIEDFPFNRRSGLHSQKVEGEAIIGLPESDKPSSRVGYFHVDGRPWRPGSRPDFAFTSDAGEVKIEIKSMWPVPRTKATRPRQIAAAIGALEARYNGEPVSARYSTYARILNLPDEEPIVVHRLVRSVIRLMLNPNTLDHVRFLAPREVNLDYLISHMHEQEPFEARLRKKK
jgi:hypothetical protein